MCAPMDVSKVTSAVWGPLDEVIITGHENGDLCQWNIKVNPPTSITMSFREYQYDDTE